MQSLVDFHTFGLDAKCSQILSIKDKEELVGILRLLKSEPFLFIGEGSNTVFVENFPGLVVINRLRGISVFEDESFFHVNVASGENWHEFVEYCLKNKMYGLENLALIPGTVGAAPIQNIGAYGVELEAFVHSVEFIDIDSGFMGYFNNKECDFGYRDSIFKQSKIGRRLITSVNFAIPKTYTPVVSYAPLNELSHPDPQTIFDTVIQVRRQKLPDPSELGNAGSFFKNPVIPMSHYVKLQSKYEDIPGFNVENGKVKVPAAWLIDKLGFKQVNIGDIACYQKQPLVLINRGKGLGEELLAMAKSIKLKVSEVFSITLQNEVQIIGQAGRITI